MADTPTIPNALTNCPNCGGRGYTVKSEGRDYLGGRWDVVMQCGRCHGGGLVLGTITTRPRHLPPEAP